MFIYCYRSLLFSADPAMIDASRMVSVEPKRGPQEIPDWCAETPTYKAALEARYIELVEIPSGEAGAIAALARQLRPLNLAPLAAETRPLKSMGYTSGLGKLI